MISKIFVLVSLLDSSYFLQSKARQGDRMILWKKIAQDADQTVFE
jgi:hypothetical protein